MNTKPKYTAPHLVRYGNVCDLTTGGTGSRIEGLDERVGKSQNDPN